MTKKLERPIAKTYTSKLVPQMVNTQILNDSNEIGATNSTFDADLNPVVALSPSTYG